ncbi:MAG TPA: SCO family protein [Candidatus Eisenbacteria bacterium]|nr:SCO family protein [Candidatus Eisenbacteria bacterium]
MKTLSFPRKFYFLLHLTVAAAACFLALRLFTPHPGAALPDYGEVPDFRLTDSAARPVSRGDLAGRPWIADFIFTRCQGQCLVMNSQTKELAAAVKGVPFISFTADPEHDTPDVLAGYAETQGARGRDWKFLTGAREELSRISAEMHFGALGDPMMHSTRFVLVDGRHRIRGYYDSNDPESLDALKRDAKALGAR